MTTPRKSDQILEIINKANRVAFGDWMKAIIDEHVDPIRAELAMLQAQSKLERNEPLPTFIAKAIEGPKRGRPPKLLESVRDEINKTRRYGWSEDPEERKREMERRMRVHADKVNGKVHKLHPRDKGHPGHDAWVAKMRRVQRKVWQGLTPEQRDERQAKMTAGKRKAA